MVFLIFIQVFCVIILNPHLFELVIDNNFWLEHGSDEDISSFSEFFEPLIFLNLQVD